MAFGPFPPRRQSFSGQVPYGNGQGGIGTQRHGATMIPGPTGAPGMASAAPAMPYTPAPVSNFQNSLNTQRTREANKAATFAAAAPYPMAPGGTEYNGAYGTGAPGLAASMAARGAFVSDNQFVANQNSGDYFQNQGLQNDANERANVTVTTDANAKTTAAETARIVGQGRANRDNGEAFAAAMKGSAYPGEAAARGRALDAGAYKTGEEGKAVGPIAKAGQDRAAAQLKTAEDAPGIANLKAQIAQQTKDHAAQIKILTDKLKQYEGEGRDNRRQQLRNGGDPSAVPSAVKPLPDSVGPQSAAPAAGNPGQAQQASADPGIHVNQAGVRIKWDGQQWSQVA